MARFEGPPPKGPLVIEGVWGISVTRVKVRASAIAVIAAVLAHAAVALCELIPAGPVVEVETAAPGAFRAGDVATFNDGGFVVVWSESLGASVELFGRRFDPSGTPLGTEFQVNTATVDDQLYGAVTTLPTDEFLVVWSTREDEYPYRASEIFGQRFSPSAVPLGTEFQVNSYTTYAQERPSIAHAASGNFVVSWVTRYGYDPLLARQFDYTGNPISDDFVVGPSTNGQDLYPRVAMRGDGAFSIVWQRTINTNGFIPTDSFAQQFDSAGQELGAPFLVHSDTAGQQTRPRIAIGTNDEFIVAWENYVSPPYESAPEIFARTFAADGTPKGPEFLVNSETTGSQRSPVVTQLPGGGYLVAWEGAGPYDSWGIYASAYDGNAARSGAEFLVNDTVDGYAWQPRVAAGSNGGVIVAWMGAPSIEASSNTVFARRYCDTSFPSCDRCPGFDDNVDGDGDGIADGCDPCTNVSNARNFVHARLRVSRNDAAHTPLRTRRIKVQGDVVLSASGATFADLDPIQQGVHVRIESAVHAQVFDVFVPAGAFNGTTGWTSGGGEWSFIGSADDPELKGIRKVTVLDRSSKAPGLVRVTIDAQEGVWPVDARLLPLGARVRFGDQDAADAGRCAEISFQPDECRFSSPSRMSCKR